MPRGTGELFQGVFILFLAILAWRMTGSVLGWFILFVPGAFFVFRGLFLVVRHRNDG
jgi:hypothetical protein